MKKLFVNCQNLLEDSFRLGKKIFDSGYEPDFLVAIWRGGTPIGIAVQEFLEYKGIKIDHIAVRTSAYMKIEEMEKEIRVHNLGYLIERMDREKNLLIIDDVFDTGKSIEALINEIRKKAKEEPKSIKIAVVYYKPKNNRTKIKPDYFIHETDRWIVFPHELVGLKEEEICEKGKEISEILGIE